MRLLTPGVFFVRPPPRHTVATPLKWAVGDKVGGGWPGSGKQLSSLVVVEKPRRRVHFAVVARVRMGGNSWRLAPACWRCPPPGPAAQPAGVAAHPDPHPGGDQGHGQGGPGPQPYPPPPGTDFGTEGKRNHPPPTQPSHTHPPAYPRGHACCVWDVLKARGIFFCCKTPLWSQPRAGLGLDWVRRSERQKRVSTF